MIRSIQNSASMLGVKSPAHMADRQRAALAKMRAHGADAIEHTDKTEMVARIEQGRWLFDCSCGSGVAAHPEWPESRCFGCGAVYPFVLFPDDRLAIEAALVEREMLATRNWLPHETVDDLLVENVAHGIIAEDVR